MAGRHWAHFLLGAFKMRRTRVEHWEGTDACAPVPSLSRGSGYFELISSVVWKHRQQNFDPMFMLQRRLDCRLDRPFIFPVPHFPHCTLLSSPTDRRHGALRQIVPRPCRRRGRRAGRRDAGRCVALSAARKTSPRAVALPAAHAALRCAPARSRNRLPCACARRERRLPPRRPRAAQARACAGLQLTPPYT